MTAEDQTKQESANALNKNDEPQKAAISPAKPTASASFKLILLVFMVIQNSSVVLVGRHARSSVKEEDLFNVTNLVMVTEFAKFVGSFILEFFHTNGNLFGSIKDNILDRPLDCLKISVPALLYLVQNTLLYVALSNLSAPLFQVTYQCKLVTTAVVSVIMLQRRYSLKQWVCLVILSMGVAIVVLGAKSGGDSSKDKPEEGKAEQSMTVGLIAVTIACFCSAFAGVYFEKVLKKSSNDGGQQRAPVSMWMRNIQLAFFSILIAVFQGIYQKQGAAPDAAEAKPFLHGFNFWAWVLIFLQAGGGLLVAAVIKYADNVLKGLATGVSVVVATSCSTILFGTPLTTQFMAGASMILGSVYLFSNNLPLVCSPKQKEDSEMIAPMLPK
eukprot:CAMPEP_0202454926 /NCGR_PEP_ID=MMETSP1360-20130828/12568_1 /ASSEMBLY_ACC=CAM_ASM_000848 /TAXON_ID=515479 /ORGANISM="Licmophora paradoxa, Strain CCMP2313" /LENGTH=384 /DNA_ID=CAMNT_0049074373 /DNA_START=31 /DNA_END=1185 /DNA_ORIENTATION=-